MAEPTLQELNDSIAELEAYRNRLREDVIAMGKKLKLPQKRIDATVLSGTVFVGTVFIEVVVVMRSGAGG